MIKKPLALSLCLSLILSGPGFLSSAHAAATLIAETKVTTPIALSLALQAWETHFQQFPPAGKWTPDQLSALSRLMSQIDNLHPMALKDSSIAAQSPIIVKALNYLAQRSMLKATGLKSKQSEDYSDWQLDRVEQGLINLKDLGLVSERFHSLKSLPGFDAISSDIEALMETLRKRQAARDGAPAPSAPVDAAGNTGQTPKVKAVLTAPFTSGQKSKLWTPPTGVVVVSQSKEGLVAFGGRDWKRMYRPTDPNGTRRDDIPPLIAEFNALTRQQLILTYEQRLDEDVDSIIEGLKRGNQYTVIVEASHVFPDRHSPSHHGAQHDGRSPQTQRLIDEYLKLQRAGNNNLKLYVIKGLSKIGILHHKNRIGWDASGIRVATNGSANFTDTSFGGQHSETFGLADDQERIDLMEKNFKWVLSMATPFDENWAPTDPVIDYDHMPIDSRLSLSAWGQQFPKIGFTPVKNPGRAGDPLADPRNPLYWIAQAMKATTEAPFSFMFAFFPPKQMKQAFLDVAQRLGAPSRALIDYGQLHNPVAHPRLALELFEAGALDIRTTAGPDEAPFDPHRPHQQTSKLHQKEIYFGWELAKMLDSYNLSGNATFHNFELWQLLTGFLVREGREYAEEVWKTAYQPSKEELRAWIPEPREK